MFTSAKFADRYGRMNTAHLQANRAGVYEHYLAITVTTLSNRQQRCAPEDYKL